MSPRARSTTGQHEASATPAKRPRKSKAAQGEPAATSSASPDPVTPAQAKATTSTPKTKGKKSAAVQFVTMEDFASVHDVAETGDPIAALAGLKALVATFPRQGRSTEQRRLAAVLLKTTIAEGKAKRDAAKAARGDVAQGSRRLERLYGDEDGDDDDPHAYDGGGRMGGRDTILWEGCGGIYRRGRSPGGH